MTSGEELEIEIDEAGQVRVHVRGRPGKACLDYVEVFRALLSGDVKDQKLTPEYYQAETATHAAQRITTRQSGEKP